MTPPPPDRFNNIYLSLYLYLYLHLYLYLYISQWLAIYQHELSIKYNTKEISHTHNSKQICNTQE